MVSRSGAACSGPTVSQSQCRAEIIWRKQNITSAAEGEELQEASWEKSYFWTSGELLPDWSVENMRCPGALWLIYMVQMSPAPCHHVYSVHICPLYISAPRKTTEVKDCTHRMHTYTYLLTDVTIFYWILLIMDDMCYLCTSFYSYIRLLCT